MGLVSVMSDQYRVVSNREAGHGRFDIALIPIDKSRVGILMEFKNTRDKKVDLQSLAKEALTQINDKEYAAALAMDGVKNVKKFGLAFCGKQVAVEES